MARRNRQAAKRFAANLRRVRLREGLSQETLAVRASLHRTEIDKLEGAKRVPRVDTLIRLAGAMAVPAGELLEGIEPDPPIRSAASEQPGRVRPPHGHGGGSED
ncbi:MAG: helix-turn-helix transcriptional regulator [Actinobacteria bacterium]|nr:helix-turn-helix transcriptional regulator [Actinomycetota bacterium]